MTQTTQHPIKSSLDLRDMLRQHLINRGVAHMQAAAERRQQATADRNIRDYCDKIRAIVASFYDERPTGPVIAEIASSNEQEGYRVENVLFDSFPGWQVNASVYIPLDFAPPHPVVVIPVGHSGKQFESYQLPAQFFARAGYIAVTFDPPGQASEKQPGNDHFVDGVRCYMVGHTSSRYFVNDALRCIDYLETRPDADTSRGIAMTGVSGGGTTTTLAALLDDRITVIGPSCCLSPRAALDISQSYAGCPETHMWRRYAEGIDEIDLLCAGAPRPTLVMAGEHDEVFRIEDTRRLAAEVSDFYQAASQSDHFQFFVDNSGHAYTLEQARQFTSFIARWQETGRSAPDPPDSAFAMQPYDELRCFPSTSVNMRTLTLDRAHELRADRDTTNATILNGVQIVTGITTAPETPQSETGQPFPVWTHDWQQILLRPEPDIQLPVTALWGRKQPTTTLLHFDPVHRNRLLESNGLLLRAIKMLGERESESRFSLLSVDVRGWGDSSPALYPYDLPGWGSRDRIMSYMSNALGDPLLVQRVRDGLSTLAHLQSLPQHGKVVLSGCGAGGIVALHVAALAENITGVVIWDSLYSFESLLEAEGYTWLADTFLPNVLLHYDLPELANALPCPVHIINPLNAMKQTETRPDLSPEIYQLNGDLLRAIEAMLNR